MTSTLFLTLCAAIGDGRVPKPSRFAFTELSPEFSHLTARWGIFGEVWIIEAVGDSAPRFVHWTDPDANPSSIIEVASPDHLNQLLEQIKNAN